MENKRKLTKVTTIIGAMLLALALILFGLSRVIPYDDYGGVTKLYPDYVVFEDISSDWQKIIINANYANAYVLNLKTHDVETIINTENLAENYCEIRSVFFDEENNPYVHYFEYDEDGIAGVREAICLCDEDGFPVADVTLDEPEGADSSVYGKFDAFKFEEGHVVCCYNAPETIECWQLDFENGTHTVINSHEKGDMAPLKWCSFGNNGEILLTLTDGTLCRMTKDGDIINDVKLSYRINDQDSDNILPDLYTEVNGTRYVLDAAHSDHIFTLEDGQISQLVDIADFYDMHDLEWADYKQFIMEYLVYPMESDNGRLAICTCNNVFTLAEDGQWEQTFCGDDGWNLPGGVAAASAFGKLWLPVAAALAVVALVLLVGSLMRWKMTVRARMLLIILPVMAAAILATAWVCNRQIEKDYVEQAYEKMEAISSLVQKGLDSQLLAEIDSLEDASNGNVDEARRQLHAVLEEETGWTDNITVEIFTLCDDGFNRTIAISDDSDSYFSNYLMQSKEDLEEERLGDTDVFVSYTHSAYDAYLDVFSYIKNDAGEPVALLDVFGYADRISASQRELMHRVGVIAALMAVLVGGLLILISLYINRSLSNMNGVVRRIAGGDFSARTTALGGDEFGNIGAGINDMAEQIQGMFASQKAFTREVMETLAGTIDAKDKYTNGHSLRVASYAQELARRMGKSEEEQYSIYCAGLLHDIGKIGVPDQLLLKTSRLTEEEYDQIRAHTTIGYDLLKNLSQLNGVELAAYGHHEKFDGSGYPRGLSGHDIPEVARIVGLANAYDALTSNVGGDSAAGSAQVRHEIERGKGTFFDPEIADILLQMDADMHD